MRIFDSHAHYNDERFNGERQSIITEVLSDCVEYILNAGTNINTNNESILLAEAYPQFYASVGIHPHDTAQIIDENKTLDILRRQLTHEKVAAVGEIGLDYHYDFSDRGTQMKWFRLQMELAAEADYPVIVHNREAHGPCMDMVRAFPTVKGIFHSFSGSAETAAELIKRDWYISFSGVVTFKNANRILDVVRSVPAQNMLIETDCPYLAPHPMRGKLNRSDYLCYTAAVIAEAKGMTAEELCEITLNNAKRIYRIK
ncbi:MAG: TatD family hydrolase [Eubacteriales bacterium]|nr:TatD family hydrolase [Eubacteriales bacterium]